jgi:hypothetical protein
MTTYCASCLVAKPLPGSDRCKRCTKLRLPRMKDNKWGQPR